MSNVKSAGPPEGAIVLTLELLEDTSRKWVMLPAYTAKLRALPPADRAEKLVTHRILAVNAELPEAEQQADLEARCTTAAEKGVWVRIGSVGSLEALTMAPVIEGADDWPRDPVGRGKAFMAWRATLSQAEQAAADMLLESGMMRFVAAGVLVPKVTPENVPMFADDQHFLTLEIQALSGMMPREAPASETTADPAPAEATPEAAQEPVATG